MKAIFVVVIAAAAGTADTASEAAKLTAQAQQLCLESRYAEAELAFRQAVELWSAMGPRARHRAFGGGRVELQAPLHLPQTLQW